MLPLACPTIERFGGITVVVETCIQTLEKESSMLVVEKCRRMVVGKLCKLWITSSEFLVYDLTVHALHYLKLIMSL